MRWHYSNSKEMPKLLEASATVAHRDYLNTPQKVIAVCFLVFLTVQVQRVSAVDTDCDYNQVLIPGATYYVYNPNYPGYTYGQRSCRWKATSTEPIKMFCQLNTTASYHCWRASIMVDTGNKAPHTYCGTETFTAESKSGEMTVTFNQQFWTGSRFLCNLQAIVPPKQNCKCGWKNPSRIVGGTETGVNEYPMMAGLVDAIEKLIFCGATIISHQYVITAAHCSNKRDLATTGVVVGEHDVTRGTDTNATKLFKIADWITHPRYIKDSNSFLYDIGVVKIVGYIDFNLKVGPACLPFQHSQFSFIGDNVTVLGWGTVEFGGPTSDTLQKARVRVTTEEQCKAAYPPATNQQLCTFEPGKDSCQFDSGGPVLWQDPVTKNLVLIGIISAGRGCATADPAINQRVGTYIDWILNVTTRDGARYCQAE